ncbi:MAG: glycosyltransferase [Ferruginibacter sp.]|uniref:glycosyltransferase n=1 Tax=Ferruginibacter sp. TaxID=1940288 RepID=UPI00265967D2|nr:glycosyltransferase [Ferruginibacter sp.]MDB5275659.1 glycosyltransferase [Ferruginibacter sp.]
MSSAFHKNIVIIGPAHPLRGGLASYDERLAKEFQQQGHTVNIYTFSLQYPGFLFPGTTQFSTEPAPADLDIHVRINSVNPLNWISVGMELKRQQPDLIVVRYWLPFMGPCLGSILRIVKQNKHTRIVCIADNIIPHEKRIGDVAFTKYFVPPIDAFITMSEKVLSDLPLFAKGKPAKFVAHPLYDNFGEKLSLQEARQHLNIPENEKIMLFFGFIRKYKGLDILLDAIKILKASKYPPLGDGGKLLIAGEFYEDRKPYDEQIAKLGIEDRLILRTEFIADSEVKYYLSAADVVIQPYRSATQSGVTPLAYHFEKPMIVTNVGGLPSLVPDDKVGLIAEPTAESIAAKITEFFQKGAAHFLPHLIEEKKKYSWSKMVETIFDVASL